MGYHQGLLILISSFCVQIAYVQAGCSFPGTWQGNWYQQEQRELEIKKTSITHKGNCYHMGQDGRHNRFYMEKPDRDKMCYSCLVIMERHSNLLQYKESVPICSTVRQNISKCDIGGDAILYTLVREQADPVACPFHGGFTFKYDNNTGLCGRPKSKIEPCASEYTLRLQFRMCPDVPGTVNQVVQFKCLATWKNQDQYLYVKMSSLGLVHKHQMYRCMKYRQRGSSIEIAATGDATCRGLQDFDYAQLTMTLKTDPRYRRPSCNFPFWIRNTRWQTLSGQYLFEVDSKGSTIRINQPSQSEDPTIVSMACDSVHVPSSGTLNTSFPVFEAVAYILNKCSPSYQCVRFIQRSQDVIQVKRGRPVKNKLQACDAVNLINQPLTTLLSTTSTKKICPYKGSYSLLSPTDVSCQEVLQSGCDNRNEIKIRTCNTQTDQQLECLGQWSENGVQYIIARNPNKATRLVNCFSFKERKGIIEFSINNECNYGTNSLLQEKISYIFKLTPKQGLCTKSNKPTQRTVDNKDTSNNNYDKYTRSDKDGYSQRKLKVNSTGPTNTSQLVTYCTSLLWLLVLVVLNL